MSLLIFIMAALKSYGWHGLPGQPLCCDIVLVVNSHLPLPFDTLLNLVKYSIIHTAVMPTYACAYTHTHLSAPHHIFEVVNRKKLTLSN